MGVAKGEKKKKKKREEERRRNEEREEEWESSRRSGAENENCDARDLENGKQDNQTQRQVDKVASKKSHGQKNIRQTKQTKQRSKNAVRASDCCDTGRWNTVRWVGPCERLQ